MKSSRPSLRATRDKRLLGRDPDKSWCHGHIMSMMIFWSQPIAPWVSAATYGQGEKFSAYPKTDVKLGTRGRWIGTRTGTGVTSTLL